MALFKSLFLIMGIQIGGWMFSSIGFYLVDKGFIKIFNEGNNDLIGISINCISSLSSTFEVPAIFLSRFLKNFQKKFFFNFQLRTSQSFKENFRLRNFFGLSNDSPK